MANNMKQGMAKALPPVQQEEAGELKPSRISVVFSNT